MVGNFGGRIVEFCMRCDPWTHWRPDSIHRYRRSRQWFPDAWTSNYGLRFVEEEKDDKKDEKEEKDEEDDKDESRQPDSE